MAFGLNQKKLVQNYKVIGTQRDIACLCWFTSTGKVMPLIIKIQDESGEIQKFDVTVVCLSEKHYCGIPTIEYICRIDIEHIFREVKLIYFKTDNKWKAVI